MRGIETPIKTLRQKVFTEVAKVAFDSQNINDDIEAIPYKITPGDAPLACYLLGACASCDGTFIKTG